MLGKSERNKDDGSPSPEYLKRVGYSTTLKGIALAGGLIDLANRAIGNAERRIGLMEKRLRAPEEVKNRELERFLDEYPRWSIETNLTTEGQPIKTYRRDLNDVVEKIGSERVYRRFCDSEYFDWKLAQIFGATLGDGVIGRPSIAYCQITTEADGPIVRQDLYRIAEAEQYLLDEGLVPTKTGLEQQAA